MDITTLPGVKLTTANANLGLGNELAFEVIPGLADDATAFPLDTLIVYKSAERVLFKGRVSRVSRSLNGERVSVTCRSADQYLEGQEWGPRNTDYNPDSEVGCGKIVYGATIKDFIDQEFTDAPAEGFTSKVKTWFTSITVPDSIKDLLCGATTTHLKSFISALQGVLAPYPYIKLVVEYSDPATLDTVFPVGALTLVDTRVGRSERTIDVGGLTPDLADLSLEEDTLDSAEKIVVYGKGLYTERTELLLPAWDVANETVQVTGDLTAPEAAEGQPDFTFSNLPFGENEDLAGFLWVKLGSTPVFLGSDYRVDYANGRILWLNNGLWVNRTTGATQSPLGASPPTGWRYPVAYRNAHLGQAITACYRKFIADAYRKYKVRRPLGSLRLVKGRVWDRLSASWIDDAVDSGLSPAYVTTMEPLHHVWKLKEETERATLYEQRPTVPAVNLPKFSVPVIRGTCTAASDDLGHHWVPTMLGPSKEPIYATDINTYYVPLDDYEYVEGGKCVRFKSRRLGYVFAGPMASAGEGVPLTPQTEAPVDCYSVEMAIRYVSWENIKAERTSTKGKDRRKPAVLSTALKYVDLKGTVIQDDSADLERAADDAKEYSDSPGYTGSLPLLVNLSADKWSIPLQVGDLVHLNGEVSAAIKAIPLIVNQISYASLDQGVVSLSFGRKEPRKNPFLPRKPTPVALDAKGTTIEEISGLEIR